MKDKYIKKLSKRAKRVNSVWIIAEGINPIYSIGCLLIRNTKVGFKDIFKSGFIKSFRINKPIILHGSMIFKEPCKRIGDSISDKGKKCTGISKCYGKERYVQ